MSLLERALDDGRIHPRRLALAPSLICLGISAQANANPIVVTGSEYGILKSDENLIYNYALIVIAALSVEYLSFRWFFRKRLRFRPALACFLGIHAISWPLTQVVSVFIGLLSFDLIPVTEIVPIFLEAYLVRRFLGLRSKLGKQYILKSMAMGNLLSFAVGWILFASFRYHILQ